MGLTLHIDGREVPVDPGMTILDAACCAGIRIPTLCTVEGQEPRPSCMVCAVKVRRTGQYVPACATKVSDGLEVESESDEVRQFRKAAIELLLSEHLGDCLAPCQRICPAHLNIPRLFEQIRSGRWMDAAATVRDDLAMPRVLSRVCHRPCEAGCRRGERDDPVGIAMLVRCVSDLSSTSGQPNLTVRPPDRGKRVAIVGAGPAGLAAAFFLLRTGYACVLYEKRVQAGGALRDEYSADVLPPEVLEDEIAAIGELGAQFRLGEGVVEARTLEGLRREFDAVLFAGGPTASADGERLGLATTAQGIQVNRETCETSLRGLFAAGRAVRKSGRTVRSVADGKAVALCIHQYLSGLPIIGERRPFSCQIGKLKDGEMEQFMAGISDAARLVPAGGGAREGLRREEAQRENDRCLRCHCARLEDCKLRELADEYDAHSDRFRSGRRIFVRQTDHPILVHEPGKCIRCGNCIRVAEASREPLGLTFVGRGLDVHLAVPFGRPLAEGLRTAAEECARVCPTAALALKDRTAGPECNAKS